MASTRGGCNEVEGMRKASRGGQAGFLSWNHGAVRGPQEEAPGQKEFWILEQRFMNLLCTHIPYLLLYRERALFLRCYASFDTYSLSKAEENTLYSMKVPCSGGCDCDV